MKTRKATPATFAVIAVCVFITLCITFLPLGETDTERAILLGAFYKAFIIAGEPWRLLTCGFVHVSLLHLFVNMFSLSVLGRALENYLNKWKFLLILCCSVIGGSVFLFCTAGTTVAVGLSGGIYGLLAAYILIIAEAGGMKIPQVRYSLLQTIGINLMINFMPGVAWQGHFGGAVTGLMLVMLLKPRKEKTDKTSRIHAAAAFTVLVIAAGVAFAGSRTIDPSDRYLLTDLRVLKMEERLGFRTHAKKMAARLDALYDISYLEPQF